MNTIAMQQDPPAMVQAEQWVDLAALVCPGCGGAVAGVPPSGWPARAGLAPQFSHPDGSVLCPDEFGRVPEPVEAGGLRYGLTEAGAAVSLDEAAGWAQ